MARGRFAGGWNFMSITFVRAAAVALGFTFANVAAASAAEPTGTWVTKNGDAHIRVAKCGAAMCGTIAWLREPIDRATGQPQIDSNNPDPAKRSRKILGLTIFAVQPDNDGSYVGTIYNADDGQSYRGKVIRRSPTQLEVQGCLGVICGSEIWNVVGR